MKIQIILTFAAFTAFKEISKVFVNAKSVQLGDQLDTISNCSDINVNEECDLAEGETLIRNFKVFLQNCIPIFVKIQYLVFFFKRLPFCLQDEEKSLDRRDQV